MKPTKSSSSMHFNFNYKQDELFAIPQELLTIELNEQLESDTRYQGADVNEYL